MTINNYTAFIGGYLSESGIFLKGCVIISVFVLTNQKEGGWIDQAIASTLNISVSTVERVRQQFVEESLESALNRQPQTKRKPHRLDGEQEAHLIALTCSTPPSGFSRWTLRLLAEKLVELESVESISHETVRQTLKKTNLSLG